jgi:competence protein ComEC
VGIFTGVELEQYNITNYLLFGGSCVLVLATFFIFIYRRNELWTGMLLALTVILLIACYTNYSLFINKPLPIPDSAIIRGYVAEPLQKKSKSFKTELVIESYRCSNKDIGHKERILTYFAVDSCVPTLSIGDVLVFKNDLKRIAPPDNFWEFNYAEVMARKGIFHQQYMQKGNWCFVDTKSEALSIQLAEIRKNLVDRLEKQGVEGQRLAFLSALLFGYKYELSAETKSAFATAGATHVLAVSGLHVGIVFIMIKYVLGILVFLNRYGWGRLIATLSLLWGYAALTGLPPSIFRASVMFSILAIGLELRRKVNVYNSLAFAAIVLLMIDPLTIFQLGFQFSFLAVAAIVYFQPIIAGVIQLPWKWLKPVTDLFAVTVAAQLGTFPLVLYYFHQFPVYFFLSNLIIVPLVGLFIWMTVILLIGSGWSWLGTILGGFYDDLLMIFLKLIGFMEHLPHAVIRNFSFSHEQMLVAFLIIGCIAYFFYRKEYVWLKWSIALAFLLILGQQENSQRKYEGNYLVVGQNRTKVELGIITNGKHYLFSDSNEKKWVKRKWQSVTNYFQVEPVLFDLKDSIEKQDLKSKNGMIHIGGMSILYLDDLSRNAELQGELSVDWLVLPKRIKAEPKLFLERFKCSHLVAGKRWSRNDLKKWQKACQQRSIAFYNLSKLSGLCYSETTEALIRF